MIVAGTIGRPVRRLRRRQPHKGLLQVAEGPPAASTDKTGGGTIMDDKNSVSRRALLRGMAVTGAGFTLAASGLPVLGEDKPKPDAPLPVGDAGKLTVIHRTEYFEAAQTAF